MTRLNVEVPDRCVDVINMFAVSEKHEIEEKYGKSTQSTVIQLILSEFVKNRNLENYTIMLKKE